MKKAMPGPLFYAVIFCYGCSTSYDYKCGDTELNLSFIGFSNADIDTLTVRQYKAADNYTTLLDTIFVSTVTGGGQYTHMRDTVAVTLYGRAINPGYDWQIYIPAKARTVFISDIKNEKREETCKVPRFSKIACACFNPFTSIRQDGRLVTYTDQDFKPYYIYIKN